MVCTHSFWKYIVSLHRIAGFQKVVWKVAGANEERYENLPSGLGAHVRFDWGTHFHIFVATRIRIVVAARKTHEIVARITRFRFLVRTNAGPPKLVGKVTTGTQY